MARQGAYRIPLRVLFYRDDGLWVAHCLEFDVIGSGDTQEEALRDLATCIEMQIEFSLEHGNFDNLFRPAPSEYFQMFAKGENIAEGEFQLHLSRDFDDVVIEEAQSRAYVERENNGPLVPV